MTQVISINSEFILFDDGTKLFSDHSQDCCEAHFLSFEDLTMKDFEGLSFDLSTDTFFKRIPNYGIELLPLQGYGYNNGYYSDNLELCLTNNLNVSRTFDISECQSISD